MDDVSMSCYEEEIKIREESTSEMDDNDPEDHAVPINDRKSKRHDVEEDNDEIP